MIATIYAEAVQSVICCLIVGLVQLCEHHRRAS